MDTIINKVAESGIITLDLAVFLPAENAITSFDLKPFLFREMILREKDYRAALQTYDWQQHKDTHVAIYCSADAIVPVWAYMLAASYLQPQVHSTYFGKPEELKRNFILQQIKDLDIAVYTDKRVVIKGCGETPVPDAAYVAITEKLRPVVKSLMYGEPCSTVPIYKKPAAKPPVI